MAVRYRVRMVDGTTTEHDRRPVHLMRLDRLVMSLDRKLGMHEEALMYVWAAATGGGGSMDEFDAWAEQVDDWERIEEEAVPPAQGSDTSPD